MTTTAATAVVPTSAAAASLRPRDVEERPAGELAQPAMVFVCEASEIAWLGSGADGRTGMDDGGGGTCVDGGSLGATRLRA